MVDCPHFDLALLIDGANIAISRHSRENRAPLHLSNIQDDSVKLPRQLPAEWNCVVCETFFNPWMCLSCGLVHCGRYANGHGLDHANDHPAHCLVMECNSFELFCYSCNDTIYGNPGDRKLQSIMRSLQCVNKARCQDHTYDLRERLLSDSSYDSDAVDLGTEEENESSHSIGAGRVVQVDEDSSSVPEDDSPLNSHSVPDGALIGGRTLRPRKRKIQHLFPTVVKHCSDFQHDGKIRGLRNLGNTCFMNAVIQALGVTDVFREYLSRLPILEPDADIIEDSSHIPIRPRYNTRRCASVTSQQQQYDDPRMSSLFLTEELRKVLQQLSDFTKTQPVSPDDFFQAVWKMSPRFRGFHQQDAHEFLRCALDRLHCELRRCRIPERADSWLATVCGAVLAPSASAVTSIFEGSIQSQVVCLTCHTASNKQETFMDLSLDIYDTQSGRAGNTGLSDCIRRFFAKEELEQCEQYMCGNCLEKRPSTKQLMLKVLPNVICFHLKRFRWSNMSRGKLDIMVDFPLTGLDITPYMATNARAEQANRVTFDLTSVVVHHGSGVSSGHYTAYGLRNDRWFHFNDTSVKECNEQTVLKQKAYLLFYTRTLH